MLHLHNSCVSDIENIEYILKKKDYNGIKTNREIKKIFKDLGAAYKNFSESLKKIHNESSNLISLIKENDDKDNSEQIYFSDCFLNIVSLIKNIYEENLAVSEKIEKNIVDEFEKEERERVSDINSIYKEEISLENNEEEKFVKNSAHINEEKYNDILIEGIPLKDIEIDLKRCLENKDFTNKYLNHTKYKIYFSELNKLNLKLDKEIYSFKQLIQNFGKNASKLLIHKSKERINDIQNKKKNILEFLYSDIMELKKSKNSLLNENIESKFLINNKNEKKEYDNMEQHEEEKKQNECHKGKDLKNNQNTFFSNLYLEKFEIREKYRIEKIYSSFRIFLKALAVKHINVNKVLYKSANEVCSYDSLIDYQKWLSYILKKDLDIMSLQEKIQKNNILTKEEEYLLMPSDYNFFNNNSVNLFEKKNENNSYFQKGELIFKKQDSNIKKEKKEKKNEKEINTPRDSQFPDEFYIPIIIKKNYINLTNKNSTNIKYTSKIKEEIKIKESLKKNSVHNHLNISTYLNNNNMNKEKDIITFLTNKQKNYEKYLLQFNNLITPIYQNEKKKDKKKWFDKNFFQGYFHEEGHNFYPFKIPTGMNNLSFFQNIHSFSLNTIDFGEKDISEYDYKLLAYESVLLVYYYLSIQLNCYFLFDVSGKRKINKSSYEKLFENLSYNSTILMNDINKHYSENNNINEEEKKNNMNSVRGIKNKDNNNIKYEKVEEENKSSSKNSVNDYFEYISYIYNVKLQNLLLIKRIISIFRIKLNLNSKINDLITLLTIPNHYMNYGYKYSFHVLDVRFRIIRILDSLNFDHIFNSDNEKNECNKLNYNNEYSIYINWLKRQLHLLYVSVYLKFSRFIKFIPYSNFSFYPHIFDNINIFKNNEEYFSYINKTKEDNSFIRYIKNVQDKINKIYNFILINNSNKEDQVDIKISKNYPEKNDINFVSFNSLGMDEKIIFFCNLLLKNIIKSFHIIYKLQYIVKKRKWNKGVYNEKKDLSNLVKYFTKIEYYDFEIRNLMSNIHKRKNQEISKKNRNDINEHKNMFYGNNTGNLHFNFEQISDYTKKKHKEYDYDVNIDHDELFKNIFINEITYKEKSDYISETKKITKCNENNTLDRDASKINKNVSNFFVKKENKNKSNFIIKKNNSNENIAIETYLTKKEKKIRKKKIFYKLNVETVLCSCWFIDRILLHFFLYFYFSCIIDNTSKSNIFTDAPYITQGIILITYYLQSGNDLTLKTKKKYNEGLESTLIPISTFILYFVIHLFYSFFDKDLLSLEGNKEQDRLQLFLKSRNNDNKEKEIDVNIRDSYSNYKNQIITVQNASKFYFIVKNFEYFLSYRTIDENILENNKNNIDLNNFEHYEEYSYSEETEEKEHSSIKKNEQEKKQEKHKKKKKKKKKKFFVCAAAPKNSNSYDDYATMDEECKRKIEKKKIKKKQKSDDMIYLKRYYNILSFFNYNHLENLLNPYVPSILSYYLNKEFYTNDYFFFNFIFSNNEKKIIKNINYESNIKYKNNYDHSNIINKENKNETYLDDIYEDNYSSNYESDSNKNVLSYKKKYTNNKKCRNIHNTGINNIIIKYNTNKNFYNFSLINISRIEKIMIDIMYMRIISCDFRNYFFLIFCNYRKFIDMYSLPYILDIFIILHSFFIINGNSKRPKRLKTHNIKDENKNKKEKDPQNDLLQYQYIDCIKNEKENNDLFEFTYNICVEDDDINKYNEENDNGEENRHDTKEIIYKKKEKKENISFIDNSDNSKKKEKKKFQDNTKNFNKEALNENDIFNNNLKKFTNNNSYNNDSENIKNFNSDNNLSTHRLSNYFKYFIYNSSKNIFYNIICSLKDDIELSNNVNYDNLIGDENDQNKQKYQENDYVKNITNGIENINKNISMNEVDIDKNNDNKKKNYLQNSNDIIINHYVDIIKKYINEIIVEILFFSNIWKHYLPLEEHPLIVLYAANKTLYYEVIKVIKYFKDNKSLFNHSLSIIVSLYNFNLLNKEIVLQTNTYMKYQSFGNKNYEISSKKEKTKNDNCFKSDNMNCNESNNNKNKNKNEKMKNKVLHYYENRNSFKASSIDKLNGYLNNVLNNEINKSEEKVYNKNSDKDDMFINLSLIISNSNNPCMIKLMFMLEKIFIKIIDEKLEEKKNLLTECLKNEKLVPLNFPDIIYNSTSVDIFSIISHILEALFEYKCPVEWIITPFLEFLNGFINKYCENYKKLYSSFIISVLNQYADKYFNDLLNLKEQQKIQWNKYSNDKKKRKIKKNTEEISNEVNIFRINDREVIGNDEEEEIIDSNIEEEFNDVNEITKRIKDKKKKKSVFYKLFDYEEIDLKKKNKINEKLGDRNDLSMKKLNSKNTAIQKGSVYYHKKLNEEDELEINEEYKERKKKGMYMSKDLINIIEEINYLFNDSDLSNSLVITWNLYFFLEQLPLIKKKFEKYILEYICARTKNVEKITQIFNNYIEFNITIEKLQKNIYTKTILDVLDTSINNIKNTINNTLYYIFKILSIRIICYEFQEEIFYNLYDDFHSNNIMNIVNIFPNTIEKFFIQLPSIYFKSILTVFIELFIKMWMLIIIEKGFSNFTYTDDHMSILKTDNQYIKNYIHINNIQSTHYFLNKKYNINEYIDMFFDKLHNNRNMFNKIINDQKHKKSKNIVSSAYNKGMAIITGKNNHEEKKTWKDNIFNFSKKKDIN
ncbi:conserved Plasmodium protein, unknown function [Plasmodium gallinaceum]|uniref:Uncharacterized protein n=1 Tax=Plasmodium gallinaceum TaxID=5849 RepID=A0A1J1GV75_PLAGA|nr:conserved Plasmodium protein, unknown function [Plasmodium gallinaceum]CRG95201.1 conserved Plasmodium protein, unknown function [Plasmodium gallinaceum]